MTEDMITADMLGEMVAGALEALLWSECDEDGYRA